MIEKEFLKIINYFSECIDGSKFEGHVFAVGGCIRDYLLKRPIKDIDVCVDLPNGGIELAEWLEANGKTKGTVVTYPNFGTAMLRFKKFPDDEIEFVQTRKECYRDEDSRNPETSFGTIHDDCQRRDFTYNAIYYNISTKQICYFNDNSKSDLENNILRTCGDADIIFEEDGLRILRAVRFSCRYNSTLDADTLNGMKKNIGRLKTISKERIQDELSKILTGPYNDRGVQMLFEIGAMPFIFPLLCTHSWDKDKIIRAISFAKSNCLELNLALILRHSFGAESDLKNLKYSNYVIDGVKDIMNKDINGLVENKTKDEYYLPQMLVNLRKFQYRCKSFENMLRHMKYISSIDFFYKDVEISMDYLKHKTVGMMKDETNMFRYKLPVDGNFIMEKKNIEAGPMVKQYLDLLLDIAFMNPKLTTEDCEKILELY
jgi:tRNA nucleotidyltransferase/poly(A) polymerase